MNGEHAVEGYGVGGEVTVNSVYTYCTSVARREGGDRARN